MADAQPTLRLHYNLPELQKLQNAFAAVSQIPTAIIDRDCNLVTSPSLWNLTGDGTEKSLPDNCRDWLRTLLAECEDTQTAVIRVSPHNGLTTAAVPIIVDRQMLGAWILDQVRIVDSPVEPAGKQAEPVRNLPVPPPATPRPDFLRLFALLQSINSAIMQIGTRERDVEARDRLLRGIKDRMDATGAMLRLFIDSSDAAMYVYDDQTGELLMMNEAFCRLAGQKIEDLLGKKHWEATGASKTASCPYCPREQPLDDVRKPGCLHSWVCFNPPFDLWMRCTTQPVIWTGGRLAQMVTLVDVTTECRMQEGLRRLAFTDRQTGIANAQRMLHDLQVFALPAGAPAADDTGLDLVCFELSLGLVRDAFGRDTAGEVLKAFIAWMAAENFGDSTLYRLEGDEYCLVVRDAVDSEAMLAADRILARFGHPWIISLSDGQVPCFCNINMAIMHATRRQITDPDLVGLIERSLDMARKNKRIFVYDEKFDNSVKEKRRLEASLVACVNRGMIGFEVHYQPIVHLKSGTWKGYEALCRWNSSGHGAISPAVFIPDAERLGLIATLGQWVLEEGVKKMKELGLDRHEGFFLSVNISPLQLMDVAFSEKVRAILHRHDYPGRLLSLEITESTEVAFSSFTRSVVDQLRELGVNLALDDFGTGYSSFNNLKNLPVDFLKTETSFVRGIESDGYMQYFFYIMSEMAHASGKRLIAEGIENREQLKIVQDNGADYIQGYFFSKPLPPRELTGMMERFEKRDAVFAEQPRPKVDIGRLLDGSSAYTLTPTILKLLNRCIQTLLSDADTARAFQKVLGIVGEHFGLDRAFAFIRHNGFYNPAHEWRSAGFGGHAAGLDAVQSSWVASELTERFRDEGMMVSTDADGSQQGIFQTLCRGENRALALMPMWDQSDLIGFVGFDHNRRHSWTPDTLILLHNLALVMSGMARREMHHARTGEKREMITEILNHSEMNVLIADLETEQIIWCNATMAGRYPAAGDSVGKQFHEVFEDNGGAGPAGSGDNAGSGQFFREVENKRWGRTFFVYESLAEWTPNRKVRVKYLVDVTDLRTPVAGAASAPNGNEWEDWGAMAAKVEEMVIEASANGWRDISFAYICLDAAGGSGAGNDRSNHAAASQMARSIGECTRAGDYVGRIGGHEFLVAFPNCLKDVAEKRIRQTGAHPALHLGGGVRFVFSVVSLSESMVEGRFCFESLLALARERTPACLDESKRPRGVQRFN